MLFWFWSRVTGPAACMSKEQVHDASADRQTDRQAGRQADRQTDRQTRDKTHTPDTSRLPSAAIHTPQGRQRGHSTIGTGSSEFAGAGDIRVRTLVSLASPCASKPVVTETMTRMALFLESATKMRPSLSLASIHGSLNMACTRAHGEKRSSSTFGMRVVLSDS